MDTFHQLKLLHLTQNELIRVYLTRISAQKSNYLKTDQKHLSSSIAESILPPALHFNLMLLSLTKYKAPQIYLNFSSVRNNYLCRGNG